MGPRRNQPAAEIEIEYCVPCELLPHAEEVTHAWLEHLGRRLTSVRLVPSHGGVVMIRLGDDLVFDKADAGYDVEEIVHRVSDRIPLETIALG